MTQYRIIKTTEGYKPQKKSFLFWKDMWREYVYGTLVQAESEIDRDYLVSNPEVIPYTPKGAAK